MVNIKPFCGYRYNLQKVKSLSEVITPPYDVLTKDDQQRYYKKSNYNIIRLILGLNGESWYDKANELFKKWIKEGILVKDKDKCIYIYNQKYSIGSGEFNRTGFIALMELEGLGKGVLPHEKTFEEHIKDRLSLMNATKANLEMGFLIYDDRKLVIDSIILQKLKELPQAEGTDEYGITHSIWQLKDAEAISTIQQEMKKYNVVIADGHHRYKTALRFKEQHPELLEADYVMVTFINSFHSGLLILPTHRLIHNIGSQDLSKIICSLKKNFEVNEVDNEHEMLSLIEKTPIMLDKEKNLKNHLFGMYHQESKKSFILRLKDHSILEKELKKYSDVSKKLDMNILHKLIIEDVLGISEQEQEKGDKITYVKGTEVALRMMHEDKKYQLGFFVNPPLMREVFLTARANETMPHKSTYFYPKIYSGIVINKISN